MRSLDETVAALRALEMTLIKLKNQTTGTDQESLIRAVSKTILDEPVEAGDEEGRVER